MKTILATLAGLSLLAANPAVAQMRGGGSHGGGGGGFHGGGGAIRGGGFRGAGGGVHGGAGVHGGYYGHGNCCYGHYGWPYGLALGVGFGWAFAAPWYYDGYYYGYYPYGYYPYAYPPPPTYGDANVAPPACGSWIWRPDTQSYTWSPCEAPALAAPPAGSVAPAPD
jgi:hypothetical protein